MRWFLTALISALPLAPVLAQPAGVLTPAPVPNRELSQGAPADRAGRPDGAERAAPFSGLPSTLQSGSGEAAASALDPASRTTAPAPSLSR